MAKSRASLEHSAKRSRQKRAWRARQRHLAWAGCGHRCATCAYRAGTVASTDDDDVGLTRLRRALLDAAQPFFCHEPGPTKDKRLCVGHMDAMSKRHLAGYYDAHPPDAPEVLAEFDAAYHERERLFEAAMAKARIEIAADSALHASAPGRGKQR